MSGKRDDHSPKGLTPSGESAGETPRDQCGLPRVSLNPADGEEAAAAWRDSVAPIFETHPVSPGPGYRASYTGYMVDGLLFSQNRFSPSTYQRTEGHVRGSEQDFITLHLPLSGTERGHLGDQAHIMAPDHITLADWAHPFSTVSEAVDKLGVVIPRSRVPKAALMYKRRPAIHWGLETPTGRLFAGALTSIWQQLPHISADEGQDLANAMLGLLDGMIGSAFDGYAPTESEQVATHLLAAMKAYLIRHHDEPELGPDQLAEAFNCSRATVYRLFREENGVKAYLRTQRLQRCFETIKSGRNSQQDIAAMWFRYGFNSSAHFRRAFQQAFGLTPRDLADAIEHSGIVKAMPGSDTAPNAQTIVQVNQWLTA